MISIDINLTPIATVRRTDLLNFTSIRVSSPSGSEPGTGEYTPGSSFAVFVDEESAAVAFNLGQTLVETARQYLPVPEELPDLEEEEST
jgi:hypothetical protein